MKTIVRFTLFIAMLMPVFSGCFYNPSTSRLPEMLALSAADLLGRNNLGGELTLIEGETGGYEIVLSTEPVQNVVYQITPDAGGQVSVNGNIGDTNPVTLTFTQADWDTPQTVTIGAVDDYIAEGSQTVVVNQEIIGGDSEFMENQPDDEVVFVIDNDTASVNFSKTGFILTENGLHDSLSVHLGSEPTIDVLISIDDNGMGQVLFNGSPGPVVLTFTGGAGGNWNLDQAVDLSAVDDTINEGPHNVTITYGSTTTDLFYANFSGTVGVVNITDNDVPPAFSGADDWGASNTSVFLSWSAATDDLTAAGDIQYDICQSTIQGSCIGSNFIPNPDYTPVSGATGYQVDGFGPGQTHYFVVRACDTDGNCAGNSTEITTVTASTVPKRIFVTTNTYVGNYLSGGDTLSVFDDLCTADPSNPTSGDPTITYKAMIMAKQYCGGPWKRDLTTDWVLTANSAYNRPDGTLIGFTDSQKRIFFPLSHSVGTGPLQVHTGMGYLEDDLFMPSNWNNCNWLIGGGGWGVYGLADQTDPTAILENIGPGTDSRHLYCVEQ